MYVIMFMSLSGCSSTKVDWRSMNLSLFRFDTGFEFDKMLLKPNPNYMERNWAIRWDTTMRRLNVKRRRCVAEWLNQTECSPGSVSSTGQWEDTCRLATVQCFLVIKTCCILLLTVNFFKSEWQENNLTAHYPSKFQLITLEPPMSLFLIGSF